MVCFLQNITSPMKSSHPTVFGVYFVALQRQVYMALQNLELSGAVVGNWGSEGNTD